MHVSVVAYLALILFVPFAAAAYALLRPALATALVLVTAVLFLPQRVGFDPPGLPPFDKDTIAGFCAIAGSLLTTGRLLRSKPGRGLDLFAIVVLLGAFATAATNKDPLTYGPTTLPGLTTHDGFSDAVRSLLYAVTPFFLGRVLYRDTQDLRSLMGVVVAGALVYSPLVMLELRLSPQFHRWVYGFHQHDFIQTMREGGYRPMVFMQHGLALAMFVLTAVIFATALGRSRVPLPFGIPAGPVAGFLALLLVFCKSLGATVYLVAAVPLLILSTPRLQARFAALLGGFVLAYPALRMTNQFPLRGLVDLAARVSQDRADSLAFRFTNESQLVQKALERLAFGWGGFGRGRIWSDWGQDISVTDGFWIIVLGGSGVVGLVGMFGMLVVPLFLALRRLPKVAPGRDRVLVGALALATAVNVLDLLPNGLYSGLPFFYAGVLAGVTQGLAREAATRVAEGA